MENRKKKLEVITKILEKIKDKWELAEWILLLIKLNKLSDDMIEDLFLVFAKTTLNLKVKYWSLEEIKSFYNKNLEIKDKLQHLKKEIEKIKKEKL